MNKTLKGILIGAAAIFTIAAVTNFHSLTTESFINSGTFVKADTYVNTPEYRLSSTSSSRIDSLGRIIMTVRNKSGASMDVGRLVMWDTSDVPYNPDDIIPGETNADDSGVFASEGGLNGFQFTAYGTPSNDSLWIYGTALTGLGTLEEVVEIINFGTTIGDVRYSDNIWYSIDSILVDTTTGGANGLDSVAIDLEPVKGVVEATLNTMLFAGVVVNSAIADNAIGEVCIYGAALVKSKPASGVFLRTGWPVKVGGGGSVIPLTIAAMIADSISVSMGFALGTKDDVSDTASVWIFIKP